MIKTLAVFLLTALSLCAQSASYPAVLASDATMFKAANNVSTTLSVAQSSSDTTLIVSSTTGFSANMLISVGATVPEIEVVCSVSGANALNIGYGGVCPSVAGRGFDGTSAAAHAAGVSVAVNMVAWLRNIDRIEIEAIESTLGVNLTNIPSGATVVKSTTYNFVPQTPGGSLVIGSNSVTMTPCPVGIVVSGTSATAMYLSGGAGTAEWVRLTGGSCTSGAPTGNVIFTAANTHSAAWTIRSATGGIDLACSSSSNPVSVTVPPGSYTVYGTIRPATGCTIDGLIPPSQNGPTGTVLTMATNGVPLFDIVNYGTTIRNLFLAGPTSPTSGSVGIQSGVTNAIDGPFIENVIINAFYIGQIAQQGRIYDHNVWSQLNVSDGFQTGGAGALSLGAGTMEYVFSQNNGGNGYTLKTQSAIQWHNVNCFDNHGWGVQVVASSSFQMDNVDCEQDYLGEWQNAGADSTIQTVQDFVFQSAGNTVLWGTNTSAPGLQITDINTQGTIFANGNITDSEGNGMELNSQDGTISNIVLYSNGQGAVSGHLSCILNSSTGTFLLLSGIQCTSNPSTFAGAENTVIASQFFGLNNSSPLVTFASTALRTVWSDNTVVNQGSGGSVTYTAGCTLTPAWNVVYPAPSGSCLQDATIQAYQSIPLTPLPAPTALTVATNTIAPTLSFHTLGTGTIQTITPPTTTASYCFDIQASGAFVANNSGNIVSAGFTAVIGQIYHACYNSTAATWSVK